MKKTLAVVAVLGILAGGASMTSQAVSAVSPERGYISVNTSANIWNLLTCCPAEHEIFAQVSLLKHVADPGKNEIRDRRRPGREEPHAIFKANARERDPDKGTGGQFLHD